MEKSTKFAIIGGIGGFILGVTAGILGSKKYWKTKFEELADAEIESLREYYGIKNSYTCEHMDISEEDLGQNDAENPVDKDQMRKIRENLKKNPHKQVNYGSYYTKKTADRDVKIDPIQDDIAQNDAENEEPDGIELTDEEEEAKAIYDDHQENKDRDPKIISVDDIGDVPGYYEEAVLYYYQYDDTVTDADNVEIDEPGYLLGDCLSKYGFKDNEEERIFVQNFSLAKIYEVRKFRQAYYVNN